jgi:hypothetical protein
LPLYNPIRKEGADMTYLTGTTKLKAIKAVQEFVEAKPKTDFMGVVRNVRDSKSLPEDAVRGAIYFNLNVGKIKMNPDDTIEPVRSNGHGAP